MTDYEIVIADWSGTVDADGRLHFDTQALEHVTPKGRCLVYATTLGISLTYASVMAARHSEKCGQVSTSLC